MKTVTVDILDENALRLLRDLEKLKVIRLHKTARNPISQSVVKKVSFDALSIDTLNFKFDRNEASER